MAWNQPGDDQGDKPRRAGGKAPALPWLRRLRQRWDRPGGGSRSPLYWAAGAVAALLWLLSGLYQVDDGQRGVLQRFGAYAGERGPGAGWHLPWPIESVTTIDLGHMGSAEFQSRMFTADADLISITCSVQYQVRDARQALFAVRDLDGTVRGLAESAARELVAQRHLAELINGPARAPLGESLRAGLQQSLDELAVGVHVQSVNLTDVQVPEPVLGAQREVVQAGEDRERLVREAQGYAADLLPRAEGAAQRQRLDAESYRLQVVAAAEGDAGRFERLLPAYERAPDVTRQRLYIETIETILARSRKVIIDGKGSGNMLYLPLDKLLDANLTRGSVVAGSVGNSGAAAGTASAPGAAMAPGAATVPGAADPAAAPAPAPAPAVSPRDDRSRERATR